MDIEKAKHKILNHNKIRHIGNCMKADKAYGQGVAETLGIRKYFGTSFQEESFEEILGSIV